MIKDLYGGSSINDVTLSTPNRVNSVKDKLLTMYKGLFMGVVTMYKGLFMGVVHK